MIEVVQSLHGIHTSLQDFGIKKLPLLLREIQHSASISATAPAKLHATPAQTGVHHSSVSPAVSGPSASTAKQIQPLRQPRSSGMPRPKPSVSAPVTHAAPTPATAVLTAPKVSRVTPQVTTAVAQPKLVPAVHVPRAPRAIHPTASASGPGAARTVPLPGRQVHTPFSPGKTSPLPRAPKPPVVAPPRAKKPRSRPKLPGPPPTSGDDDAAPSKAKEKKKSHKKKLPGPPPLPGGGEDGSLPPPPVPANLAGAKAVKRKKKSKKDKVKKKDKKKKKSKRKRKEDQDHGEQHSSD